MIEPIPRQPCEEARRSARAGFTLLELLVCIGILAMLFAIVTPALQSARRRGYLAVCLANASQIGAAAVMYHAEDSAALPWFYVHRTNAAGDPDELYPGATDFSSFSWGGMLPEISRGTLDCQITPPEVRPLNRFLAPGARRFDQIKTCICPADDSAANPSIFGGPGGTDESTPNWREYGTSYSINWHWLRFYARLKPGIHGLGRQLFHFGRNLLHAYESGDAARFIWMSENPADQLFNSAVPPGHPGGVEGKGWHGEVSRHTVMFLDGHAEHGLIDTRFTSGTGWTIGPPRTTR